LKIRNVAPHGSALPASDKQGVPRASRGCG
jgi:hypothetical protein